jgi:hypothetical protein
MRPQAISKARARFTRAEEALAKIQQSDGFRHFEAAWTDFLLASNAIYTSLEQGAKSSPQSRQWFGRKKIERREDPVLQYVHQARNADEHGLDRVYSERREELAEISGPAVTVELEAPDGRTVAKDLPAGRNTVYLRSVRLVPVTDTRFGTTYQPPLEHLGKTLTHAHPSAIARLVLDYQAILIDEAEKLPPA